MPGNDLLVSGQVLFDADSQPLSNATIYVRLEDVSRSDAQSRIIAEQVIRGVSSQQSSPLPFEVRGDLGGEGIQVNVRVHIDVDGDGQISPGDYISMQSYPVALSANAPHVQVYVHRV
jgi:uncharacterized lipoprotein YbaY